MSEFSEALLSWYRAHRRVLPWREDPSPYHVLLSEFMLQQTRVDTAIPYYERFLAVYPTIQDLAKAKEEDVLRLWQGLGYYSRAKNLHKAAIKISESLHGITPSEIDTLRTLPGVGPYMSHAVASIVFNQPVVAVDGNLLRVYSRLACDDGVFEPAGTRRCESYYLERIDEPSAFNQALMDLGELVCLPSGAPLCDQCPFRSFCLAHKRGKETDYPPKKKAPSVKNVTITMVLAFDLTGAVAVRRRKENGLLASMDEFPNVEGEANEKDLLNLFPGLTNISFLGTTAHRFSHLLWDIRVYQAQGVVEGARHVPVEELKTRCSLPTAFLKTLRLLKK
ncbi:MAG: A/G-specific adenine glycosylase [Bacilli bacterium]|nr:A/G-specific adenine glycosylase [Bacilli bacterium]